MWNHSKITEFTKGVNSKNEVTCIIILQSSKESFFGTVEREIKVSINQTEWQTIGKLMNWKLKQKRRR